MCKHVHAVMQLSGDGAEGSEPRLSKVQAQACAVWIAKPLPFCFITNLSEHPCCRRCRAQSQHLSLAWALPIDIFILPGNENCNKQHRLNIQVGFSDLLNSRKISLAEIRQVFTACFTSLASPCTVDQEIGHSISYMRGREYMYALGLVFSLSVSVCFLHLAIYM